MRRLTRKLGLAALTGVAALVFAAGCGDGSDDDSGESGSNALEFIGRVDQTGPSFNGYGYVTHVDGIDDSELFTGSPISASEKTARITFSFKTQLSSRAALEDVFALHSKGTIDFFFNATPAASFDDPASFSKGEAVGSGPLDFQSTISVYAPDKGIFDAAGSLTFDQVSDFDLDGSTQSLAEKGQTQRVNLAGTGARSNAVLPKSVINFAGRSADE